MTMSWWKESTLVPNARKDYTGTRTTGDALVTAQTLILTVPPVMTMKHALIARESGSYSSTSKSVVLTSSVVKVHLSCLIFFTTYTG